MNHFAIHYRYRLRDECALSSVNPRSRAPLPENWPESFVQYVFTAHRAGLKLACMRTLRFAWLYLGLAMLAPAQEKPTPLQTTPKLEILNQQIKNNEKDAQAYSNRGYTLALLGRKEEARADLQNAVALKDSAPMRNRVGWAYFNLGDYAEAVREFEAAAAASNHNARYDYYSLVLGYWGTGDTKRALENYQLAVERDPRLGEYKTLDERTAEWTPLERRAMHETYVLWSKAWRP